MIVRIAPPEHLPWLAERAGLFIHPNLAAIEAVRENGAIVGMMGFDGWLGNSCQMHVALEHPSALRHILRPSFHKVFDDPPNGLGYACVFATVRDDNKAALELVEHVGFRKVGRSRDCVSKGVGLVFHELRREDCRFLRG